MIPPNQQYPGVRPPQNGNMQHVQNQMAGLSMRPPPTPPPSAASNGFQQPQNQQPFSTAPQGMTQRGMPQGQPQGMSQGGMPQGAPRGMPQGQPQGMLHNQPRGMPQGGMSQGAPRGMPQGQPQGMPQGGMSQGAPRGMPQGQPQGMPQGGMSQGAPRGMPQGQPQGMPQGGMQQGAPRGMPQGQPQGMSQGGMPQGGGIAQVQANGMSPNLGPARGPGMPPGGFQPNPNMGRGMPNMPAPTPNMGRGMPAPTPNMGRGMPTPPNMGRGMPTPPNIGGPTPNMGMPAPNMARGGPPMPRGANFGTPAPPPSNTYDVNNNNNAPSNTGSRRIDPAHMPRPSRKKEEQAFYSRQALVQGKKLIPNATDSFVAIDDGNATPRFMRMTLGQYPSTSSLLSMSKLPLACVIQPFASPLPGEEPVPVVDLGDSGPTRCTRCRGYVNCFCTFDHSAGYWQCNLCGFQNPLPPNYQGNYNSMYGSSAQPELAKGSVDFVVKGGYITRKPQEPIFLFAVDVSTVAVQTGTSGVVLRSILKLVKEHRDGSSPLLGGSRARVGVLTYSEAVHFYDIHSPSEAGHKTLIVSDFEEGFCPLPDQRLAVNVAEKGDDLVRLLESLLEEFTTKSANDPQYQQHTQGQGKPNACVSGTALQAAVSGLNICGGKLVFFMTQPPTHGPGSNKIRKEVPTMYSTEKEYEMFTPSSDIENDNFFGKISKVCCEKQISLDVFSFGDDFKDLALWGYASNNTGGCVVRFPMLASQDHLSTCRFQTTLEHHVRRDAALEAVLKVRSSTGVRVEEYLGIGLKRTRGGELDMAFVDEDNTCIVILDHDGSNLEHQKEVYLQCAVLYTSVNGQRRVRVHNIACPVTNHIADIFRNADIDAVTNYMARKSVDRMQRATPIAQVHSKVNSSVVEILCSYRKNCAKNPTGQQLILPEALKLLPLYVLSLIKCPALRKNLDTLKSHRSSTQQVLVRADQRCEWFNWVLRSPLLAFTKSVYPMLLTLRADENPAEAASKPNLAPSTFSIQDEGNPSGYFLSTGLEALLVITSSTDPRIINQCGFPNYDAAVQALGQRNVPLVLQPGSSPIHAILEAAQRSESSFPKASTASLLGSVQVVLYKSADDPILLQYLTEDSLFQLKSLPPYDEFLCQCHASIQNLMRNS